MSTFPYATKLINTTLCGFICLVFIVTGCSSTSRIAQSAKGSVSLEDIMDWSFEASHPAIIDQGGLIPALAQLAEDNERMTGIQIDAKLPPFTAARVMDRERSLILFRIAQEALRNVAKHANATKAQVAVEVANRQLTLTIADDGRGFDSAGPQGLSGLGLISMGERARLADGNFSLFSKPGAGTTSRVTVPLRD